jgi:hypothetical protein
MAFSKPNAGATNVGPKLFDATPSNYTSLGSLIDPTKPDVRDLYIQTFGDQGITGLLDVTGAKKSAGQADEVHWYEEGRMNRKFTCSIATNGTVTLETGHGYTAGAGAGANGAEDAVQLNDVILTPGNQRLIVSSAVGTGTTDTFVVTRMDQASVAQEDNVDVVVIGNAYGQGTGQPAKPFEMDLVLRKNPYIITKETFHVNGSQATNIGWLNVNGQNMWYLKGEMDARRKFMNSREAMLVFGQIKSASGAPEAGATAISTGTGGSVTGSEGYFQAVENRGIVSSTPSDQNFDTMDDLDSILILLDKEGAPAEYAMYTDRGTSLAVDDLLASGIATQVTAGLPGQFGAFNNDADMAVNLGFKSFTRGGYTFHKHDWKLLNSDYAAGHTSYQGALIPLGNVVDPKSGGSNPSLEMNYKAAGNYSREMEHWVEGGGVLGYATNGDDLAKFHYRSECNLCVRAANQHVVLKGNNLSA